MLLNGLARFNIDNLEELESMSFREFNLRMEAYMLKLIDDRELISFSAWQNRAIKATKKIGKKEEYVIKKFEELFNREKEEERLLGKVKEKRNNTKKPSKSALDIIKNINN